MLRVRHTSARVKENGGRLQSPFRKVCERFEIQRLNRQQEEAIRSIVLDKKDVFVNLPTGFGKSMTFQGLPEVFSSLQPERERNVVVVVSPLVSLMKDQVSRLTTCIELTVSLEYWLYIIYWLNIGFVRIRKRISY